MTMKVVDCDVHPTLPNLGVLLDYVDDYWRDFIAGRGLSNIDVQTYRQELPITAREDWRTASGRAALTLEAVQEQVFDRLGVGIAICNVVHAGSSTYNPYLGVAVCKATNDWLAAEWLAKDDRLRGSIVVPVQEPELAAEEIERLASDRRFVQVLMPVAGEMPFGRRFYWPIYRAAQKYDLPVAIHPGGGARYPQSYVGWHTHYSEDYFLQAMIIEAQIQSLMYEGVFQEFDRLKVVVLESGVSWLPAFLTAADNKWMSLRREVPWVAESPTEMARKHLRFTTQPFDAPSASETTRIARMLASDDLLLFSSDYPHWQFDADDAFPPGFDAEQRDRIARINPLATYSRLEAFSE